MTVTEYMGYRRHHQHVEHVLDRERSKAGQARTSALVGLRRTRHEVDRAIGEGRYDDIGDLLDREKQSFRGFHAARRRLERRRLLSRYEN